MDLSPELQSIKKVELSLLQAALILGVALLYFFIYFSAQYLPLTAFLTNNADVLFIEDLARDLNTGGNLFDWRLTQAPYLFPDIALARVLGLLLEIGRVGIVYQAVFGIINTLLIYALCRQMRINSIPPLALALTLYSLSYTGGLSGDGIAQYFGVIGHHSGIITSLLLATLTVDRYLQSAGTGTMALAGLFAAIFIGTISDSLAVVAFAPSLMLTAFLLLLRDRSMLRKVAMLMATLLAAIIAGKAFGYTNPFPQDREFMQAILSFFPSWTLPAVRKFAGDLIMSVTTSKISALILGLYLIAALSSLSYIWKALNRQMPVDIRLFLCVFSILAPLMTIAAQLTLGLYTTIDSSRQWAPLIFLAVVFSGTVAYEQIGCKRLLEMMLLGMIIILLAFTTRGLYFDQGKTTPTNSYQSLINCMLENHLPEGAYYVSDYWYARPIRLYSEGRFSVSPYGQFTPFTNASNLKQARAATPRFIITGLSLPHDETIKKFGPPNRTLCQTEGAGLNAVVLDYSDNSTVRDYLQEKAKSSY